VLCAVVLAGLGWVGLWGFARERKMTAVFLFWGADMLGRNLGNFNFQSVGAHTPPAPGAGHTHNRRLALPQNPACYFNTFKIFILTPGDTRAKHRAHSLSTFHSKY
jgi:hypothetical protein